MNAKGYGSIPSEMCYWITLFMQSATPKINRYLSRVIDRGYAGTHRLRDRYLVDASDAQPLEQLLQVVTEWEMVLAGAGTTICPPCTGEH